MKKMLIVNVLVIPWLLIPSLNLTYNKTKWENNMQVVSTQDQQLEQQIVLSGKLNILMPSDFSVMSSEKLALKYPSVGHRPSEVYTNEKSTINIALNHTTNKAKSEDLPNVRNVLESQFNRAPFTLIKSEMRDLNGMPSILLEFISPAVDTKIYNLMVITSLEGRLVMITFNCTEAERKQWTPIAKKIIGSITLRK